MGFFSEKEFRHERFTYDCVWRRVSGGAPSHVFEVQVHGNLFEALTRLKHAFDLWNSRLFLVAPDKDIKKARWMADGSFHEIQTRVDFLEPWQVAEFYSDKLKVANIEKRLR